MCPSLVAQYRIYKRVDEQLKAFREGFTDLIPPALLDPFDARDLEVRPLSSLLLPYLHQHSY